MAQDCAIRPDRYPAAEIAFRTCTATAAGYPAPATYNFGDAALVRTERTNSLS
jgi:hypothetical protein